MLVSSLSSSLPLMKTEAWFPSSAMHARAVCAILRKQCKKSAKANTQQRQGTQKPGCKDKSSAFSLA